MKNIISAILLLVTPLLLIAQKDDQSFEVKISSDSILLGNYLEVRYTVKNVQGKFEPPKFEDFDIVSGPNQSTSVSIINGHSSQTASYSYFIKPRTTGLLHLEPAYLNTDDSHALETPPLDIYSLPNPDGVVQNSRIDDENDRLNFGAFPFFQDAPDQTKKKKKLKVTKI
ncbi:MAG: BatD family protein [Saprospiraceae bacterium]|nr:BatD family protein [Saprospiraceae bacterium]